MKYWTVQDLPAWEVAQQTGVLTGNAKHITDGFEQPYDWMVVQMQKRLGVSESFYPIWLWTTRPDLRTRGFLSKGDVGVLLEVEVDSSRVLLSDYDSWHCVLNWFEIQLYEDEVIDREKSWERVFDFELLRNSAYWAGEITEQGTVVSIPTKNIKVLRTFTGR